MSTLYPNQIEFIEQQFPANAWMAFAHAQQQAFAQGRNVLVSDDGAIYRVFPDGSKVFVKKIKPLVKVQRGTKHDLS